MSPREQVQKQLVDFLTENRNKFNAPCGVIPGLKPMARGKCRTITFGVARYFDGEIIIIGVDNISINGRGALASKYCGHFTSVEEVIKRLS